MKKLSLLKTLLMAVGLCMGGSVWAENYVTVYSQDFEDAETYTTDWVQPKSAGATISQASRTKNAATVHFYQALRNGSGPRTTQFVFPSVFKSYNVNYKFDFYWAMGTTYGDHGHSTLKISNANDVQIAVMDVAPNNDNNQTYYYKGDGTTEIGYFKMQGRGIPSTFYHVTLEGIVGEGIYITVKTEDDVTTKIAKTLLTSTYAYLGKMDVSVARSNYDAGQGFDDFTFSINIDQYKTRATAATTAYNAVKNKVMNPTQKSAIDAANTALAAFDSDDEIVADISGYVDAITDLETANANAENSATGFSVLNDLITNAVGVTGYVAPTGAESVFSANPGSDVDVAALTASVRAAIITAGTVNENTDITALIANSSFELGTTAGWVIVASDDTGARTVGTSGSTYYTSGADGSYLFNTWSKGTPVKQTVGTLPAGRYKLTAMVASNGATVFLTMNDQHNAGYTTVDGDPFTETEYTFTLGTATEVTIGAVGGNGTTFTAEGYWWYKADKFTLTYLGEDPLEQAKAALNDEIDAATTVKDAYTAKVGTAPFKYPVATYNALVTELTEATTVKNSGSTTVTDYTDAKDELEAAKDNMSNSVLNQPDGTKYYRLYSAGSDLNVNLLQAKNLSVNLSTVPAAVKIVPVTNGYNIRDVYNNNLMHMQSNGGSWGAGETGQTMRGERFTVAVQDDGTVKFTSAYASIVLSAASQSDGSYVGRNGAFDTWEVSEPVDITDVTLAVNATAGWGTFIAPYDNLTPSTVKAYTVSYTQNNTVFFTENETGVLSANTPYVLSTEEAEDVSVAFKGIANNDEDTYTVNGLVGLLTAGTVPVNSYVMQYQAEVDGIAFYKVAEAMTGTKNRCYLDLSGVPTESAGARADISFLLFDDDTTGISSMNNVQCTMNNEVYNLNGQRVEKPTKGLYIKNGKKVVLK